jgi:hypothetical protein
MKTNTIITYFTIVSTIVLTACSTSQYKAPADLSPEAHVVKVEEVIQSNRYTYLKLSADGRTYWSAIGKAEVTEGGIYFWTQGTLMKEFESKDLKRVFDVIIFISDFTDQPITTSSLQANPHTASNQQTVGKKDIKLTPAQNGITIEQLFKNKDQYNGQVVKIRGEVTKFSGQIMERNWVHIQDGTSNGNEFDLTLTTTEFAGVGEVFEFEGRVSLNKDFGAGYVYDVVIENARVIR